jgi:HK97 family phage prohead protease
MPLPKPKSGETKDEFIERCMSHEQMKDEYKDKDQRLAVCFSQWEKENGSRADVYDCECIDCGYKFESEEHCRDIKCPKCGGTCRRAERPGPGQKGLTMEVEKRSFPVELNVEKRGNEGEKIRGHAAVFDKWSEDLGGFREQIKPGAFTKALKASDVKALWNHDSNIVLGRTKSGTLKLEEDDKGLSVEITPPSWANGYMETIKRGDVSEMSFAFIVGKDEWNDDGNQRTITEYDELLDVSPVTYPAYPQTSVKIRSLIEKVGEERAINLLEEIANAEAVDLTSEETQDEAQGETENQASEETQRVAKDEDLIKLDNLKHFIEIEGGN